MLPADGPGESRQLTRLTEAVEAPTWSPDGSRLAFTARAHDPNDDETDVAKRAPRRLTRLQHRLDHDGWTEGRTHHLYVVALDGSEPVQLTDGDHEDEWPAWSPDGRTLAFTSARHPDWDLGTANDVFTVPADGGEPRRITATDGGCLAPVWSPDGARIAYLFFEGEFDEPRHGRVAVVDVASGARSILTEDLDRTAAPYPMVRAPIWDGDRIVFAVEDAGRVPIYAVPADGSGSATPIADVGGLTGFDLVGDVLVHSASTRRPASRRSRSGNVGSPTSARRSPARWRSRSPSRSPPSRPTAPRCRRGSSGRRASTRTRATRPSCRSTADRSPSTASGSSTSSRSTRARGTWCCSRIRAAPPGTPRSGARAIRGPVGGVGPGWGSVDYDDLMAVTDEAIKRFGFVDPERLAVMGGSYGGYMTSWIVGHTDRFRCAISERAVNDLASEDGSSDIGGFFKGYIGAYPWEAPDAYRAVSPLTYAPEITTPLLILHSEEDLRCPISQGEQLFTVLRALGRDVTFVRFPAESHELTRSGSPTHRVQRFELVLEFLDRHLR